jgi:hypothetical protein
MNVVFDSSMIILPAKTELLREVSEAVDIIISEEVKKECLVKKDFGQRTHFNSYLDGRNKRAGSS